MLAAAATCPATPLLVPDLAGGAVAELAGLRAAARAALAHLTGAEPDLLVLLGPAAVTGPVPAGTRGHLAPYGVDLETSTPPGPALVTPVGVVGSGPGVPVKGKPVLELSLALTVGTWLLRDTGCPTPVLCYGVADGLAPPAAAGLGRELAGLAPRVAVLAMGEGSACRREGGPGGWDERGEAFDIELARALERADTGALAGLDPVLAERLMVTGRVPWQVLAGMVSPQAPLTGALTYAEAPYGVTYLVVRWTR